MNFKIGDRVKAYHKDTDKYFIGTISSLKDNESLYDYGVILDDNKEIITVWYENELIPYETKNYTKNWSCPKCGKTNPRVTWYPKVIRGGDENLLLVGCSCGYSEICFTLDIR